MSESFAVDGPGRDLTPDEQDMADLAEHAGLEQLAVEANKTDAVLRLRSPEDTRGWVPFRRNGVECWRDAAGEVWTRAKMGEQFDAVVEFTRIAGIGPLHLVRAETSANIRSAGRKAKRAARELTKRGYA